MGLRCEDTVAEPGISVDLSSLLKQMVDGSASDLLLKADNRPLLRQDGVLSWADPQAPVLKPWETEELLHELLPDAKVKEFENHHEVDFGYSVPGLSRFRIAAYKQRGTVSIALRVIPYAVASFEELGLPDVIRQLAEEPRGVVLVTGTTSSGKSTTLAAMIEHINRTFRKHVVTIEEPIEYLHRDDKAAIDQREVGDDTSSFQTALKHVLRQDPDVILIGEMRDEETVRTALAAAETGHLVLSTIHTLDAGEAINRIIDFFAPHEHQHVRAMVAGTLKGIVSQRLATRATGAGRVPVCEILTMTGRVHDAILDPENGADLYDLISEGGYYGMQTFDQALYGFLTAGTITMEEALKHSSRPHDFKLLVAAEGHLSTSMADLEERYSTGPDQSRASLPDRSRSTVQPASPPPSTPPPTGQPSPVT